MLNRNGEKIRAIDADSEWTRSFDVSDVKCLVVCRGPVRKEAFDVFAEIGVREFGMSAICNRVALHKGLIP